MKCKIFLLIFLSGIIACSKKSVPTKTTAPATTIEPRSDSVTVLAEPIEPKPDSVTVSTNILPAAMIVIDGYGKVLTPAEKLPNDSSLKPDYSKLARSFTPQQMANLKYRYKTIPPKVLYVPEQYAIKSLKGTYCIYKKKFWYWKKQDGLFHLDEIYYR